MSSLWNDLRVGLRIGRASVRDRFRRQTDSRREKAAFVLLGLFILPGFVLFVRQAYSLGVLSRGGIEAPAVLAVARNALLPMMGVLTVVAGLEAVQQLGDDSVRSLLLTSASTRAIVVGKIVSLLVTWFVLLGLGFSVLVAYAAGARTPLFPVAVLVALVPVFVLVLLAGLALGYLLWLGVDLLGLSEGSRQLVTAVLYLGVVIAMFAGGSLVGGASARGGITGLIPTGEPLTPIGWYADLFFVGSPMTPTLGARTLLAAALILGAVPLALGLVVRLAPLYWYASPADEGSEQETATAFEKAPSELIGRTPGTLTGRYPTLRVLLAIVRNARRQPNQYVYLFYYLFPILPILVQQLISTPEAVPLSVGASFVLLGVWLAGGVFCLNPLGTEGSMLSQLVLAERRAESFVHARLLAGSLLGVTLTTAGVVLFAAANGSIGVRVAVPAVIFAAGAAVTSAALALGLGSVLPKFEAVEVFQSIETVAPSIIAAIVHAVLSALLLVAGIATALGVGSPETPLSALQQVGAVGGYVVTLGFLGDASRRYAVARFRDHGYDVVRTDRPFAVYAAVGLMVLSFLIGQAVSIAAVPVLGLDQAPLVVYPTLFVVQYAGFALVAVGFLYATHRGLAYVDLSLPSPRQVGIIVGGVVASFVIWAVASLIVANLGLPATDHALFDPSDDATPTLLLVLVPLVLFVNGPVEELLYRNVIQKYLTERFSVPVAIVIASAVFALAHVPAYYSAGLTALSFTLTLLFVISCLWGWIYDYTGSLLVVSAIHGLYNAVLIAGLYVQLT
ncbi:CPBP family intramembrane metalloprotease [Halovenus sp. WSH3]|uniref:CPBP family intramembrane metalloprotease n=1 Tax=Halovenus carboxidivorans TaxID=2692199 RepID=A0A6B0T7L5_9EURY|nr:type II CAAX endopeptidase family protein [Halovenus carboxidivorans]MXR50880.1 CPBP family intramembrane metalloprotease [Halovenus carboxidivorans]